MTIDNDSIRTWLQFVAVLVMPICSMVYTWIATRDKDNSQHIKAVEAALGEVIAKHASRIDRLEAEMKHLPHKDEMTALMSDVKGMKAAQEAALRESHGLRISINRIEDFLLKK